MGPKAIALWLVLLAPASCSKFTDSHQKAERRVTEFHALVNEAKFDQIYDGGAEELQKAATRSDFTSLLAAVQRKLGKVVSTSNKGWRVNTSGLSVYVNLVQETNFETGRGTETFVFVVRDETPVLIGYNISSNELITR